MSLSTANAFDFPGGEACNAWYRLSDGIARAQRQAVREERGDEVRRESGETRNVSNADGGCGEYRDHLLWGQTTRLNLR